MKKKLLVITLILAMCFALSGCIHINIGENEDDDKRYESGDAAISDNIKEIDIEWVDGKIDIVYADVDKISFTETSERKLDTDEMMCYKIDGSELKIKFAKPSKLINFDGPSKDLTLTVPKDLILENLSIDGVSANISIEQAAFTKEIDIDVVSGNVTAFLYGGADEINVDSVSGNIEFNVPDEGFTLEFDTVSGYFTGEFATTSNKDTYIYGDGSRKYEVDTVSGNLMINKLA